MKKYALALLASSFLYSHYSVALPINEREDIQENRINQGVASGELTRLELHRLNKQQTYIDVKEAQYKSDGKFTARERASIQNKQNQASRSIYRQKHDEQNRPD